MVGKQQRAKAIDCPRNEDTCDVTYLVGERGIVLVEAFEQAGRRHGNAVSRRLIVSLAALMAQIDGDGGEEGIEFGLTTRGLNQFQRCSRMEALGQTFDLIG